MGNHLTGDPYWNQMCAGCAPDHVHTNLQCVMWIAQATRTPLAEAKVKFRQANRQAALQSVQQPN